MTKPASAPRLTMRRVLDSVLRRLARQLAPLVREELVSIVQREVERDPAAGAAGNAPHEQVEVIVDHLLSNKQLSLSLPGGRLYLPNDIVAGSIAGEYMVTSNPRSRDFFHPEFREFCRLFQHPLLFERKLWEWAFIYQRLSHAKVLRPGKRGLGFGVGLEKLTPLFAGLGVEVTATDSPVDQGWGAGNMRADTREQLFNDSLVTREAFDRRVSFEFCDMNRIPEHLSGYDFCWSSCALEHLGSLAHGLDFIVNSIEKTLRVGGVACHTTELNLSSNEQTLETSETVLYRKRDLDGLCAKLAERGHAVEPLRIEPGDLPLDYLVDVPPYGFNPHLKLWFEDYVTTSVGIVAHRGR